VRFGDVHPDGRVRLDAVARYLQDVSNDDTSEAGLADDDYWVVRRTVIEVRHPARFREQLAMATFCSGLGGRWAERRIELRGERAAVIDAAVLWVRIDEHTGRPVPLGEQFLALYAPTAAGRQVTARLQHPSEPPPTDRGLVRRPWSVRTADLDLLGHVNNAATWQIVEQALAPPETWEAGPSADRGPVAPFRAELEYRAAIEPHNEVTLVYRTGSGGAVELWAVDAAGRVGTFVTAVVEPLGG
jgi:acyl-ACP thioesterase